MQRTFKAGRRFVPLIAVLAGLFLLFLLTQWLAQRFRTPGHMDVLDAQTMEMTVRPPAGAMPVETETLRPGPFTAGVTYPGNVVAWNEIAVYPRTEGRIVAMPVYSGDAVRAGQLLARLDARELNSRLNEAIAGRLAATRQAEATRSLQQQAVFQEERARQAVLGAEAMLKFRREQIHRSRNLVRDEVITREEAQRDEADFANAEAQHRQALADLRAARQASRAAFRQTEAQRAQVEQAAATARTQGIIQNYARITAPFDGYITQRMVGPGTVVGPGMPILQLARLDPIRIQINVASRDLPRIHKGNAITIGVAGENPSGKPVSGKVSAIFPKMDLQTRTGMVEAWLDNASRRFLPGDFVTVFIATGIRRDAISVPDIAVTERGEQHYVWVISEDGRAYRRNVTTGDTGGGRTWIADGLRAGETIIVRGYDALSDGDPVARTQYGRWGAGSLPQATGETRLSRANGYRIRRTLGMFLATVRLTDPPPHSGRNALDLEMVSGPGMKMPLGALSVSLHSAMPAMAGMPVAQPTVHKTGDGRFRAETTFNMPGLWRIEITVKDGGRTLGVFPVEVEVPGP